MTTTNMYSTYEQILEDILINGEQKSDRTGTGTISAFSRTIRYNLQEGFPLITSKFVPMRLISSELKWFLRGSTDVRELQEENNHIWDEWRAPYESSDREIIKSYKEFEDLYGDRKEKLKNEVFKYSNPNTHIGSITDEEFESSKKSYSNEELWPIWELMYKSKQFVYSPWHDFLEFKKDSIYIPHYDYWVMDKDNFSLRNDYFCFIQESQRHFWCPSTVIFSRNDGYDYGGNFNNAATMRRKLIPNGYMGPIYGSQWRTWNGEHDQIKEVMKQLKNNPDSRRMIVSAWNADKVQDMALPPCHVMFQLYVSQGKLSLQIYQRSADMFLGVPFNIASYALLTHVLADYAGLEVGDLIWVGGDCHIYSNHIKQVEQQLLNHKSDMRELPSISINRNTNKESDISEFIEQIHGYNPHKRIKAEVAV